MVHVKHSKRGFEILADHPSQLKTWLSKVALGGAEFFKTRDPEPKADASVTRLTERQKSMMLAASQSTGAYPRPRDRIRAGVLATIPCGRLLHDQRSRIMRSVAGDALMGFAYFCAGPEKGRTGSLR